MSRNIWGFISRQQYRLQQWDGYCLPQNVLLQKVPLWRKGLKTLIYLLIIVTMFMCQIVAGSGGTQIPLHAGGVPSYFQYPAIAGCVQPGTQAHIIQHGGGTMPQLCNGGVKFILQPTATIPVAPPPPLCITSLVLTPVSGFQGECSGCHRLNSLLKFCTSTF